MNKLFFFVLFFLFNTIIFASISDKSEIEMQTLLSGKLIVKKEIIKDTPWPKVTILSIINATPLESISIFTAYNEHKDFIPDLLTSKVIKEITKTDVHISFELNIPWPLSNSKYVTGNKLSREKNNSYQVKWYFVKSDSSKDNYGKVVFSPYKDKTIMEYQNFTQPKSSLAKLFKKKMIKKTKETVIEIKKRIEMIRKTSKIKTYILDLKNKLNHNLRLN